MDWVLLRYILPLFPFDLSCPFHTSPSQHYPYYQSKQNIEGPTSHQVPSSSTPIYLCQVTTVDARTKYLAYRRGYQTTILPILTVHMCSNCSCGSQAPAPIFLAATEEPIHSFSIPPPPQPNLWCIPFEQGQQEIPPPPPPIAHKKRVKKEKKKKSSSSKPPALKEGTSYVYAKRNTNLHIFKNTKIWETDTENSNRFDIKVVALSFSVSELIERLLDKEGDACKGWTVTEVVEKGDGEWSKVSHPPLPRLCRKRNTNKRYRVLLSSLGVTRQRKRLLALVGVKREEKAYLLSGFVFTSLSWLCTDEKTVNWH